MQATEIKPGVYWVGFIDWNLEEFHGYTTPRGTTYNAYLIIDEQVTLVDTVKHYGYEQMMQRISSVVEPENIDNLVVNHVEMDHSGSFTKFVRDVPDVTVITSPQGKQGLTEHYGSSVSDSSFEIVQSGDEKKLGEYSLSFLQVPMVHWPDSMVTYVPELELLLSNDAFGQHMACAERFDDEVGWGVLQPEAAKYYANIVLPYSERVVGVLESVSGLDISMIAPSHGVIWRSHIEDIVRSYEKWATHETEPRAVIVYDTMWGSTEKMALAVLRGMEESGVPAVLRSLQSYHRSEVIADVLQSRIIAVGSPTLNRNMLPSVSAFLTYMKGLQPKERVGFAFGSYGWSGEAAADVQEVLSEAGMQTPEDPMRIKYVPEPEDLEAVVQAGHRLADALDLQQEPREEEKTADGDGKRWVCTVCGYVYDPQQGDEEAGISPGTEFAYLPDDWVCPVCGADKDQFERQQ